MIKVFEDYFSELQADMVSICLEYVENKAERIYIYCSFENGAIASGFFYKINGKILKKNQLNDAVLGQQKIYDVSVIRQKKVISIINDDIKAIRNLCMKYKKDMPTQMKLIYDVKTNSLNANYSYDNIISNDADRTAYDVIEEWYQEEKIGLENN